MGHSDCKGECRGGEPQRLAILLTLSSLSQLCKSHWLCSINNISAGSFLYVLDLSHLQKCVTENKVRGTLHSRKNMSTKEMFSTFSTFSTCIATLNRGV